MGAEFPRAKYCQCACHDGEPIMCSCFLPCCHEPARPRTKQTPRPPLNLKISPNSFDKFVLPIVRKPGTLGLDGYDD